MKTATIALAFAGLASAHTRFTTLFINSQSQGDGTCIRMDMNPSTTTAFVNSTLTSQDMACGSGGNVAVNRTCPAKAGDSISLLHRSWADGAQPGSIDPSHKGSTAVYMKKMGSASDSDPWSNQAAGDGWFKISYDGFSDGSWGTEKMIADNGIVSTTIPSDLAGGYYLIRSEALALQNIVDEHINPQFYVGCAQVYVDGTGSSAPTDTATIPGYIDASTPALSYNIYHQTPPADPFEEFGPALYAGGSTGTNNKVSSSALVADAEGNGTTSSSGSAMVGACPSNTVLEVGNACLTELPSWSDDTPGALPKCWAASQSCWDELTTCWNGPLSPAVNAADQSTGCNLWNKKCEGIVSWCHAGNTQGPPDEGKVLTPTQKTLRKRNVAMVGDREGRKMKAKRSLAAKSITAGVANTA